MTAVAVWTHRPTAEELLDARLARGWEPIPTAMRDGPKILGYAACLVPEGHRAGATEEPGPG